MPELLAIASLPSAPTDPVTVPPPAALMLAARLVSDVCVPAPERFTVICLVLVVPVAASVMYKLKVPFFGEKAIPVVFAPAFNAADGSVTVVAPVTVENPVAPCPCV